MPNLSAVDIIGGGPAGLYASILLRRLRPDLSVRVHERNPQGATFGFGVVFSDQALDFLNADDPETHALVTPRMERWRNMTLNHPEGQVIIDGVGFAAIGRLELIEILRHRAEDLGVTIRFGAQVDRLEDLTGDLVIGADGLNSVVRDRFASQFNPNLGQFGNRFAWFGANRPFDTLTQTFVETSNGPLNAHHYRYSPSQSTFIVECDEAVYQRFGFGEMTELRSAEACSDIFAKVLKGARLLTNRSTWRRFPRLWCDNWVAGKHVLLGDAAHTAHFSIGSGTRLAMEDAIALVQALAAHEDRDVALAAYNRDRPPIARKIVDAANTSATWYDSFGDKLKLAPLDFGFNYITRSGRVDMDRLRRLAPGFMARYEAEKAAEAMADPVSDTVPGAVEIGFDKSKHPNCSVVLWDNLARNPDSLALVGPSGQMTYRELIAEAARWGNAFASAGLARGDRIAMFLDDTPVYPAAFFGAVRAGFVPVLLNIQTPADALAYFLRDSGAQIAVTEAAYSDLFADLARQDNVPGAIVVVNGPAGPHTPAAAFLRGQPSELAHAPTGPDDMAFWMYSSGSTGRPKGIVHLHHDMAYTQASFGRNVLKLRPDDICFSVPKTYFAYGFGNSITFPFSVGAATLYLPGQPTSAAVLTAIDRYRPTVFFGLPTLYTALTRSAGADRHDLSSLRQSMSAAEILSEEAARAWKHLVGHSPTEGLGSTEMLHIYLSNRLDDHRTGAAGARVPGYEIRLETPDGHAVAAGEEGVMLVRGHSSAPCYWNRPDKTGETMMGDWIHTGDRFVEREGYYYFQGRVDDLIKVSGQWVWPLEVERCLSEHPDIHECAVLAQPLEDKRMALRAVVCLAAGVLPSEAQTKILRDHVKSRLAPFKAPRLFDYVAEIPKTGTGKIDRQALAKGRSPAP